MQAAMLTIAQRTCLRAVLHDRLAQIELQTASTGKNAQGHVR